MALATTERTYLKVLKMVTVKNTSLLRQNISNDVHVTVTVNQSSRHQATEVQEVIYGVTSALSFLLNVLFCVVMIRRPEKLKRPHNILLFTLAITDLLTGL